MPDYVTGFYRPDSFPFEQRQAFAYDFFPAVSPAASDARSALLVWVHGGAWRFGDNRGLRDISRAQGAMRALFQRAGWAVASVNYRYSHQGLFPAPLHDVAEAVRFFRANAAQFGVDAGRIAIAGGSAGGHLAPTLMFQRRWCVRGRSTGSVMCARFLAIGRWRGADWRIVMMTALSGACWVAYIRCRLILRRMRQPG